MPEYKCFVFPALAYLYLSLWASYISWQAQHRSLKFNQTTVNVIKCRIPWMLGATFLAKRNCMKQDLLITN